MRRARAPVFFIQAENDYDLAPSRSLAKAIHDVGKNAEVKIHPKFGRSPAEGHGGRNGLGPFLPVARIERSNYLRGASR